MQTQALTSNADKSTSVASLSFLRPNWAVTNVLIGFGLVLANAYLNYEIITLVLQASRSDLPEAELFTAVSRSH